MKVNLQKLISRPHIKVDPWVAFGVAVALALTVMFLFTGAYLMAWFTWGVLFFCIEIPAEAFKTGYTLSEVVWRFIGVHKSLTNWEHVRRIAFIAFWGWLTIHFFTGGWA